MTLRLEGGLRATGGESGGRKGAVDKGELDVVSVELLDGRALGLLITDGLDVDDLDTLSATTVAGGDIVVHLSNSTNTADVTELLVHVVGSAAAVEPEPDTVVLDGGTVELGDLLFV